MRARQIPEWSTYDAEIAQFARQLAERGDIDSGIVATDANVLADQAAGIAKKDPAEIIEETSSSVEGNKEGEHVKDEL